MQLNINGFYENVRADEYEARFDIQGELSVTIKAASPEEAKAKAEAMMEDPEFGLEMDEVDRIDLSFVRKTPPMFLVERDGRKMQVSRLQDGDRPREPDDRGF